MTLYTYELHITMCLKCISPSRGTTGQHSCQVGQLNWQLRKLTIFMSHLFKTQNNAYSKYPFLYFVRITAHLYKQSPRQVEAWKNSLIKEGCLAFLLEAQQQSHRSSNISCRSATANVFLPARQSKPNCLQSKITPNLSSCPQLGINKLVPNKRSRKHSRISIFLHKDAIHTADESMLTYFRLERRKQ